MLYELLLPQHLVSVGDLRERERVVGMLAGRHTGIPAATT